MISRIRSHTNDTPDLVYSVHIERLFFLHLVSLIAPQRISFTPFNFIQPFVLTAQDENEQKPGYKQKYLYQQ